MFLCLCLREKYQDHISYFHSVHTLVSDGFTIIKFSYISRIIIYWASKILHHSSNCYSFFKLWYLKIMNWVWIGISSQRDFMHQQWNCPVCCGGIHKNVKNTKFDPKIKSIGFPFWTVSSWQWPLLWLLFSLLRSYQSWSNQLTCDTDPDMIQTSRPKTHETKLPKGSIRRAECEYWPCKRVLG